MIIKLCILIIIYVILAELLFLLFILNTKNKCFRIYPTQSLVSEVKEECKRNPLSYLFLYNETFNTDYINFNYLKSKIRNNYLFFTIVDRNSFKYLLNLYHIYLVPYNIKSLVTVVFDNVTLNKCKEDRIFCMKIKWPNILDDLNTKYKMKVWFMKYILINDLVKSNISVLYIDSDVIFVQNCLDKLINKKQDIVLLKSQSNQVIGNAVSNSKTIIALNYGYNFLIKNNNSINKYFQSADQSIFTIIIKKFKELTIGFYDLPFYTVGLPPENSIKYLYIVHPIHCIKELSIKERLLYYNDENNYYTSNTNKYITIKRNILIDNFSYLIKIIKLNNFILILPDQLCKKSFCFYKLYPSFGDQILVNKLEKNKVQYRESSFLRHPLVPKKYKRVKRMTIKSFINKNINDYISIYIYS